AQAKVYAYIYAKDHELAEMTVQLTYIHVVTDEIKKLQKRCTFEELALFVHDLVKNYAPYAKLMQEHQLRRDQSIESLPFPFEQYREGQRKLAGAVYTPICEQRNIFANATTGIGKTMSRIVPAVNSR